jgi:hypothetical protein
VSVELIQDAGMPVISAHDHMRGVECWRDQENAELREIRL